MKRNLLKAIIAVLCITLISGCSSTTSTKIGTGTPGEVAKLEWSEFDNLIDSVKNESDFTKRIDLMHQAEDILMDTGAVIPLYYASSTYLVKPGVSGVYVTSSNHPNFTRIRKDDGSKSLKVYSCVEPATLDPVLSSTVDTGIVASTTMAGLYFEDENDNIVPGLAKSCTVSDDKCTYTFELKNNLKWSDGSPLTADDFVYSWKRGAQTSTGAQYGYMFNVIKGYPNNLEIYSKNNGNTFEVHLSTPCAYFLELCAFYSYYPVKKGQVESASGYMDGNGRVVNPGAWANEAGVISSGPFTVESWKHNESMVLKKNPYYYDADKISADKIELMLTNDLDTVYNAYKSGNLDFSSKIPKGQLTEASKLPDFHTRQVNSVYFFMFNINSPLFEGMTAEEAKTFRKAISCAIDRQFIVDTVILSGSAADSVEPPTIKNGKGDVFKQNTETYTYPYETGYYDPAVQLDTAREMLRSIGFEFDDNGKLTTDLTMEYTISSSKDNENIAACLQADMEQLGINLNVNTLDWNVFITETRAGKFESKLFGWNSDYNDALSMLEIFTSDSPSNDARLGRQ